MTGVGLRYPNDLAISRVVSPLTSRCTTRRPSMSSSPVCVCGESSAWGSEAAGRYKNAVHSGRRGASWYACARELGGDRIENYNLTYNAGAAIIVASHAA